MVGVENVLAVLLWLAFTYFAGDRVHSPITLCYANQLYFYLQLSMDPSVVY